MDGDGAYALRRIIGLPEKREVYDGEGGQEKLLSKVTYEYDLGGDLLAAPEGNPASVAQHEAAYIGAGFTTRGNLSRIRRWDVSVENGVSNANNLFKSVASETGYNTLGSVVFTRDALGHRTSISYADSDGGARLAYPTTITDPDGFTSSTWYNYDMGAVTKNETPQPHGADARPAVTRFYDAAGRPSKVVGADGGYAGWVYGASGLFVKELTKVETDKDETFVMSVTDGAGGVVGVLREHPGEGTGYAASRSEYDPVNRVLRQYDPAEVSVNAGDLSDTLAWAPAGEDATPAGRAGWHHTSTAYDWKGRPLVTTHEADGSTFEYMYGGCGCAGGEVVTTRDEVGRRQRITHDVLGRPWKTQVITQQDKGDPFAVGANEVAYSTETNTYDALDRVIEVREREEATGAEQVTTTEYDGHGRLWKRHLPQYVANKFTTFVYNGDDTLATVTDPRDAVAAYSYEGTGVPSYAWRNMSRLYMYDHVGRVIDAGGNTGGVITPSPYRGAYGYDAFGNMTSRSGTYGYHTSQTDTSSYVNNRRQGWDYDAGGRVTHSTPDPANPSSSSERTWTYDAAGRLVTTAETAAGVTRTLTQTYDGDGQVV